MAHGPAVARGGQGAAPSPASAAPADPVVRRTAEADRSGPAERGYGPGVPIAPNRAGGTSGRSRQSWSCAWAWACPWPPA